MKYMLLALVLASCQAKPWAVVAKTDQLILVTVDGQAKYAQQISAPFVHLGRICVGTGELLMCGSSLQARLIRLKPLNGIDPSELLFNISPSPHIALKP
jgi:hypothetical protein